MKGKKFLTSEEERLIKFYAVEMDRRIYKFFRLHKEMLENESYRAAYEQARTREINRHARLFGEEPSEDIGEIKDFYYDMEAKKDPESVEFYRESVLDYIEWIKDKMQ